MILQALVNYYEALALRGEIARLGWSPVKVSYALNLNKDGELIGAIPLKTPKPGDKKGRLIPKQIILPAQLKRSGTGANSNFLCDNSSYFLGIDDKGKPERTENCFSACKDLHLQLLSDTDSESAKAICAFFRRWEPGECGENQLLFDYLEDIKSGANLIFMADGIFAHEDRMICDAWQSHYEKGSDGVSMQCLVSGKRAPVARLHPAIKGVRDAQSSGASLVSFNERAYESYGREKEQGLNSPVSEYSAFAYAAALNYMLSDKNHTLSIGNTTVVFWAEGGEAAYQDAFSTFLRPDENSLITDNDLLSILGKLSRGMPADWGDIPLSPENRFYILGLSPNAARLSVRFFLRTKFGPMVENLKAHYERIRIEKPRFETRDIISLKRLLNETVNPNSKDKAPSPQMSGDVMRSILQGAPYPATLYNGVMLRIRAERMITYGKAAIIKAYLLRNNGDEILKEVLTVELNEQSNYQPYVLGRLFSVLEQVQEAANPGINSTIRDKYFNSACATPAVIFPLLTKLSGSHVRKLDKSLRVYYEKQIGELMGRITESYPQRLDLAKQGAFQLGYYHQTQKRYEKKNKEDN